MTTTSTTTVSKFQLQVLAGIAAGEVKRVKVGNLTHVEWYRPAGHVSRFGTVYTRRPTHTVNVLVEAGLVAFSNNGKALLTRTGKAVLKAAAAR